MGCVRKTLLCYTPHPPTNVCCCTERGTKSCKARRATVAGILENSN